MALVLEWDHTGSLIDAGEAPGLHSMRTTWPCSCIHTRQASRSMLPAVGFSTGVLAASHARTGLYGKAHAASGCSACFCCRVQQATRESPLDSVAAWLGALRPRRAAVFSRADSVSQASADDAGRRALRWLLTC